MNERIKALYKTHIIQKAKDETYTGQLTDATHVIEAYNPLCGDQFTLYLKVEDDVVKNLKFNGYGCSISKASTAVLAESILGKSLTDFAKVWSDFMEIVNENAKASPEQISNNEYLLAFAAAREFPERKTCATLSWEALAKALITS
ncbi:Fe-S cluster assembly sulfur transfer protein SufU [Roseivirga pacifica]|uniref:Fe-S cluster assembly sulfur transfer protein SufU n=1 Tax=Roseivirga pacifica TaxID=1267423 RepID=UPI0020950C9C|nr:SUF system NifU family Fe-S cluster assembly protein [Roseivirga pacifica]MCO6360609.1 SUF system NifU family Fe-S cluster assembly protein [Roseivirga pacifica]MCO6368498.1 SUF system NifU family Fe-S cluster assembly protein [Roseivirga pacifica]MCO6372640.1 SUF system NifU family Fe-S cluster assembly protein [Roseivirga pacifica]MCO6376698.1 SUF system NifU family Fe-S cluster assembly protein [Roseivirga pacifica]MCO6378022.1 SUF system NifU family Fe-S cluster assembly protein [Roseiv